MKEPATDSERKSALATLLAKERTGGVDAGFIFARVKKRDNGALREKIQMPNPKKAPGA